MAKLIHFLLLCCLSSIVLALPEKCASLERQIALYLPHVTNTTHSTQIRFPVSLACCNCANRILQELLDTNCTPSLAIAVESIGCGLDLVSLQQKVLPMPRQELFERYPVADIVCCVIIAAVSGLAVASGIGGGGIFVPLLMVLLRFPANIAAGMSQFLIFGGGVAGIILNLRERHPTSNIPLVDTSILLYFAPAMMLGVQLGVVANHAIPDAIIRIIFITTILAGMYSTVSKAVASWRADRAAISGDAVRLEDDELGDEMHNASCPVARRESSATVTAGLNDAFDRLQDPQYDGCDNAIDSPHVHPGDCRQDPTPKTAAMATQDPGRCCERYTKIDSAIPVKAYGSLVALWVVTTVLLLYRGGGLNRLLGGGASGLFHVDPCGTLYWVLWGCNIAVFFAFTATSGVKIWRNQRSRRAVGYAFADGTLVLTPLTVLGLGTFTALSGILAGVVGTGAAMLLAPLLMRSGVLPSVCAATTGTLILFSSASASMAFLATGTTPLSYSIVYSAAAFVGAIVGKYLLDRVTRRYRVGSVIVILIVSVLILSLITVVIDTLIKIVNGSMGDLRVSSFCPRVQPRADGSVAAIDDACSGNLCQLVPTVSL